MDKTITITRDEFKGAVMTALDNFIDVGTKNDEKKDPMEILALGMTAAMVGAMIEKVLFGPSEDEEEAETDAGNQ